VKIKHVSTTTQLADGTRRISKSAKYYAEFVGPKGLSRIPLFASKSASTEMGRKIELMFQHRMSGEPLTKPLMHCLESMDSKLRDRLLKAGVVSLNRVAANRPLTEHLSDWRQSQLIKGRTQIHACTSYRRCIEVFKMCSMIYWWDLVPQDS